MKIYYLLIVLLLISCIKNKKNEVNLDLVPPIPRQANILSKDTSLNRKTYTEIKNSQDPEVLLEALNFADFFNDSVFLWSKLICKDKVRYMIFDLVNYTTLGDRALYFIMKSNKYLKTEDEKIIFCISLLRDKNSYHLHEIAGYELNSIIKGKYSLNEFYIKWLSDLPASESGYILVRTNQ
jgi:hypothetical protein